MNTLLNNVNYKPVINWNKSHPVTTEVDAHTQKSTGHSHWVISIKKSDVDSFFRFIGDQTDKRNISTPDLLNPSDEVKVYLKDLNKLPREELVNRTRHLTYT